MPARRLSVIAALFLVASSLGGCMTPNPGVDDALSLVNGALGVANVALAASGGGGRGYSAPNSNGGGYVPSSSNGGGYVAPASNGYSQKGAFDDCAKLYGSAGMEQQARTCRLRSDRMGSLR